MAKKDVSGEGFPRALDLEILRKVVYIFNIFPTEKDKSLRYAIRKATLGLV
jgi:hypothetical protein